MVSDLEEEKQRIGEQVEAGGTTRSCWHKMSRYFLSEEMISSVLHPDVIFSDYLEEACIKSTCK